MDLRELIYHWRNSIPEVYFYHWKDSGIHPRGLFLSLEGFRYPSYRFIFITGRIQISILEVYFYHWKDSDIHPRGLYIKISILEGYIPLENSDVQCPSKRVIYLMRIQMFNVHSRGLYTS